LVFGRRDAAFVVQVASVAIAPPDPTTPAQVPEENQKIVPVDRPPPRAEPTSTEQTVSEPVPSPKTTDSENTPIPEAAPEPTTAYHFSPGPGNPETVFPHSSPTPAAISVQAPPNLSPGENTPNQGVKTRRATAFGRRRRRCAELNRSSQIQRRRRCVKLSRSSQKRRQFNLGRTSG
jgi:hypothetical protein